MADATERRWVAAAERWYRLLLAAAFPRSFREEVGDDTAHAFRDSARSAYREGGWRSVVALCAAAGPRVVGEGVAERWDALARGNRRGRRPGSGRYRGGLDMLAMDLRHAARGLRSSPRFTLAIVLTFALGVGVNTTVFSFVRGILLRPLPVADAERILLLGNAGGDGLPTSTTAPPAIAAVAGQVDALEGVAAFAWYDGVLSGQGDPVRLVGAQVGPGYLATLGQPPALGREFTADEQGSAAPPVILISHALWQSRFGGDPGVLGRTVQLDGEAREIVGVLPPAFVGPHDLALGSPGDFLVPMWWNAEDHHLGMRVVRGVARLAPGATLERARGQLEALSEGLTADNPGYGVHSLGVMPLREYYVAGGRGILLALQAAVALVLLIGAVNVMNVALARGIERRGALAVRAALGAGRGALVRAVVTEVLLASLLGGALGALLALAAVPWVVALAPGSLPQLAWVRVDGLTLAGAAAFTLVAGLLAGLVPALRLLGRGAVAGLTRDGLRATSGPSHRRLQGSLAAAQVALAVALLVGAGLLVRSFASLMAVDLGYDPEHVAVLQVDFQGERFASPGARVRFLDDLVERLEGTPEVAVAGFGTTAPQHGLNNFTSGVAIVGREPGEEEDGPWAYMRAVQPSYHGVLGLEIVEGRPLARRDFVLTDSTGAMALRAALVNTEFAARWLPDGALGARIVTFGDTVEVVGVVESMRYAFPGSTPEPEVYAPFDGRFNIMMLVARGRGDDAALAAAVREIVRTADASIPVARIPLLSDLVSETVAAPRVVMLMVLTMAAVAVGIATVGIYGVLSFVVARRRREIGVRMALGAGAGDVLGMLLRQGARMVGWGLVLGLGLAWGGSRVLGGVLYGVSPRDPLVFGGVAVLLGAVALTASWLPAVRAARLDPARTLREG